jgi:hypothetical protein
MPPIRVIGGGSSKSKGRTKDYAPTPLDAATAPPKGEIDKASQRER